MMCPLFILFYFVSRIICCSHIFEGFGHDHYHNYDYGHHHGNDYDYNNDYPSQYYPFGYYNRRHLVRRKKYLII